MFESFHLQPNRILHNSRTFRPNVRVVLICVGKKLQASAFEKDSLHHRTHLVQSLHTQGRSVYAYMSFESYHASKTTRKKSEISGIFLEGHIVLRVEYLVSCH